MNRPIDRRYSNAHDALSGDESYVNSAVLAAGMGGAESTLVVGDTKQSEHDPNGTLSGGVHASTKVGMSSNLYQTPPNLEQQH